MEIFLTTIVILMVMYVAYEIGRAIIAYVKKDREVDLTPVASNRGKAILN